MESFQAVVERGASRLGEASTVRIVSHNDADGIAAAGILAAALSRLGKRFTCELTPQPPLDDESLLVGADGGELLVIIDLQGVAREGALVIDHHPASGEGAVNPVLYGMDGSSDACSATIAFLIAKSLSRENSDLAGLALVGIIGDAQEKRGLHGLNKRVVSEAVEEGIVRVEERLRLFGYEFRSVLSMLIASYDLDLPGVTGNPSGARRFLGELGIPLRDDRGRQTRYNWLTSEQRERLFAGVGRLARRKPVTAPYYELLRERGLFRDARQYATLLNSCGRLEKAELGLRMCLGEDRDQSPLVLREYRERLRAAYELQRSGEGVERTPKYVLINGGRRILPSLIGTVCSMITRSGDVPEGVVALGLARYPERWTKVSARVAGEGLDVRAALAEMLKGVRGNCGGHANAAGALIASEDEERFLENARRVLNERVTLENAGDEGPVV